MQTGYLKVNSYTANRLIPVSGTKVTVFDKGKLTAYRVTDENGATSVMEIEAPDKALSESPGNSEPFSRVDVYLKREGYIPLVYKGVQIFPGEVSVLNADMIPSAENPEYSFSGEYNIKPQNL